MSRLELEWDSEQEWPWRAEAFENVECHLCLRPLGHSYEIAPDPVGLTEPYPPRRLAVEFHEHSGHTLLTHPYCWTTYQLLFGWCRIRVAQTSESTV